MLRQGDRFKHWEWDFVVVVSMVHLERFNYSYVYNTGNGILLLLSAWYI